MPESRYDNDPQVVRVNDDEIRINADSGLWTVRRAGDGWIVEDPRGRIIREPMQDRGNPEPEGQRQPRVFAGSDAAIEMVIGAPW